MGIIGQQALALTTGKLDNHSGYLGSQGSLNNREGLVSSGGVLTVNDNESSSQNLAITNTQGTLITSDFLASGCWCRKFMCRCAQAMSPAQAR